MNLSSVEAAVGVSEERVGDASISKVSSIVEDVSVVGKVMTSVEVVGDGTVAHASFAEAGRGRSGMTPTKQKLRRCLRPLVSALLFRSLQIEALIQRACFETDVFSVDVENTLCVGGVENSSQTKLPSDNFIDFVSKRTPE